MSSRAPADLEPYSSGSVGIGGGGVVDEGELVELDYEGLEGRFGSWGGRGVGTRERHGANGDGVPCINVGIGLCRLKELERKR